MTREAEKWTHKWQIIMQNRTELENVVAWIW